MKIEKEHGLKNRALRQLTVLIVITMVIAVGFFYLIFKNRMVEDQALNAQGRLHNLSSYLNSYMDEIDAIANNANYTYYLQNYLINAIQNESEYNSMSSIENMQEYEMSSQAFSDILLTRTDISSIMVFGNKSLLFYKTLYSYRNVIMDYSSLDWYQKAKENPDRGIVTGPHNHAFFNSDNEKTISLSRTIQSCEDGSFLGVILIDFNLNRIEEICESTQGNEDSFLCMLNEEGSLVYEQKKGVSQLDLENKENLSRLNENLMETESRNFRIKLDGTDYLVTRDKMEETGWTLLNILPYSTIIYSLRSTSILIMVSVALTLILTLVALNRILTGIIKPLKRLQRHMARVSIENLNQQLDVKSDDEIGMLTQNFNEMLDRIENLKEQVVEEQEDKRKYELQALQAQINPHFLYNTLDSIIWMAEMQDPNIVPMTEALAKLFRISLNKGKEEITVKKEMEHVRNYLIIQSMRYADKFTYEILVEPEVENCRTLKLIVQPVVENCIYHGIKKKRGKGHIKIEVYRQDDYLKIKVQDDGCGMTEETCKKILSDEIQPENISGSGIGVKNVEERIVLRYGREFGLKYESILGEGTTVEYTLPCYFEEEES